MNTLKKKIPLLPQGFKLAGWIIALSGIFLSYLRFYLNLKIGILELKVFAIYSSYFETKYFTFVQNNYTEEAAGALLLLGLIFIAFSKEKVEDEGVMFIRMRSLFSALLLFLVFVLMTILFVFGFGFLKFLIAEVFILPASYILMFRCGYRKYLIEKEVPLNALRNEQP